MSTALDLTDLHYDEVPAWYVEELPGDHYVAGFSGLIDLVTDTELDPERLTIRPCRVTKPVTPDLAELVLDAWVEQYADGFGPDDLPEAAANALAFAQAKVARNAPDLWEPILTSHLSAEAIIELQERHS